VGGICTIVTWRPRLLWAVLSAAALLAFVPGIAQATGQEEEQGAAVLREIEAGKLRCDQIAAGDFELVGEYAMGRMFATAQQHEAMNQMMVRMIGAGGERRVHEAMGRRFAGCPGGRLPPRFGQMMGAVGAMGMMGGGMMGGGPYSGPGSMMGWFGTASDGDEFDGPSAAAMVGMMAVLIGAVAIALLWLSRRRRSPLGGSGR
jgi:hypothetical protein